MSPAHGAAIDPMVRAATAGDEGAFAEMVQRHRRELHVHCYRMLGSFEEAEDRVQETFLRAWRSRHTFEGRSTYRAWLYRIATNVCLESLRRRPRRVPAPEAGGRLPPYSDYPGLQPYPDRLLDEQYIEAHERADPAAVVALLAEDARLTISPMGMVWDGKEDITPDFMANMSSLGEFRCVATGANRQPAVANYLRAWEDEVYRAFTLVVLGIKDGKLVEMATFVEPGLFEAFGLPSSL